MLELTGFGSLWMPSLGAVIALALATGTGSSRDQAPQTRQVPLPPVQHDGSLSVERALTERRSRRELSGEALALDDVGQLLWAAQGVTEPADRPSGWNAAWAWMGGLRTAPSAGALYPLELYLLAGAVEGLAAGLYRYIPQSHALEHVSNRDLRARLAGAALGQRTIGVAPAVFVITAIYDRTAFKYGDRAERYVHIEVGSAAQNVYLQAEALNLGTLYVGAFRDGAVTEALGLPAEHAPLGIMPVGPYGGR